MADDSLTPATLTLWDRTPYRFKRGAVMGVRELGRGLGLDHKTVYYHLLKLQHAGLVRRIPIGKVKHRYAGIWKY